MWLSKRRSFLKILVPTLVLSACGFTPRLWARRWRRATTGTIEIDEPVDRNSYLLVQQLEHRLGRAVVPSYGLSLALEVKQERMAINATNITTRFNVIGKATYALRDLGDGKVLHTGTVDSFTGYSATGSTVATQGAERDARERLMTILADQITTRLIAKAAELAQ